MKTAVILFTAMLLFTFNAFSQTIYKIPFASTGNKIELTVSNASSVSAKFVNIKAAEFPKWIKMKNIETAIGEISPNDEKVFEFEFAIDKTAPVDKEETMKFIISSGDVKNGTNESWSKEIKIKAGSPDKYELFQNYPNPFNPTTTISYQLPYNSIVSLKVYDILGREVITLLNGEKKAGYYEEKFDAGRLGSGVYIYRLIAQSTEGTPYRFGTVKKMMVIK